MSPDQENKNINPFEHFFRTQNSNTEMLYEAIPYVSMQLKKPLALFLKMQELQQIFSGFDNQETLEACGLCDKSISSPTNPPSNHSNIEDMLLSMRKKAVTPMAGKLDFILNFIKAEKILTTYQKYMSTQPVTKDNNTNDLFNQILPLFLANSNTSQSDLIHIAEQIQNAAKGANYESKLAN